jgi:hypothetical protein
MQALFEMRPHKWMQALFHTRPIDGTKDFNMRPLMDASINGFGPVGVPRLPFMLHSASTYVSSHIFS